MDEIEKKKLIRSVIYPLIFVAIMWGVKLLEIGLNANFAKYGLLPKSFAGLPGIITSPLKLTGTTKAFDISVKVQGGGTSAQAEAIRHGISRALLEYNNTFRATLKKAGFLTRDARIKERKKPGLKRARRAPQFSKR